MHSGNTESKKEPKTDLDKKFLHVVEQAMSIRGIQSDRAMSIELGRHPNFINRVRNGLQSAPPDAWDALFDKYPAARNITTNNMMSQGGGQAIGTNHGTATRNTGTGILVEGPSDLAAALMMIEQLKSQLADKERTIQILLKQNS